MAQNLFAPSDTTIMVAWADETVAQTDVGPAQDVGLAWGCTDSR